jgi:putative ABC transport system substrate-binding protein
MEIIYTIYFNFSSSYFNFLRYYFQKVTKYFISLLLILTTLYPSAAAGQEILVLQSLRIPPYEKALAGFRTVCDAPIRELVLSETGQINLNEAVRPGEQRMILAIGMDALTKAKAIDKVPVVYLMVLNPMPLVSGTKNISGISMSISPEKQLSALIELLPQVNHVGILYDPKKTGGFVKEAEDAAKKLNIVMVSRQIWNPKDVAATITALKGQINAFWMIPDVTVFSPETTEFLLLFSLENRIPVMSFSEKYVELGALFSVSIDPYDTGLQAGELARQILAGNGVWNPQHIEPRKGVITINTAVAKKMGITIDEKVMKKARIIE